MTPPVADEPWFRTERLRARSFRTTDAGAFTAYRADPEMARYQSWSDFTLDQGEAFVAAMERATPGVPGEWFQVALEEQANGALVGDLAFRIDPHEQRQAEVGFTLAPAYQRRGLATEALAGLLTHLFSTYGLHRVVAVTDARNASAAAVLGRVGMRQEGHLVENVFFKGEWGSELLFAILDREWSALP